MQLSFWIYLSTFYFYKFILLISFLTVQGGLQVLSLELDSLVGNIRLIITVTAGINIRIYISRVLSRIIQVRIRGWITNIDRTSTIWIQTVQIWIVDEVALLLQIISGELWILPIPLNSLKELNFMKLCQILICLAQLNQLFDHLLLLPQLPLVLIIAHVLTQILLLGEFLSLLL